MEGYFPDARWFDVSMWVPEDNIEELKTRGDFETLGNWNKKGYCFVLNIIFPVEIFSKMSLWR